MKEMKWHLIDTHSNIILTAYSNKEKLLKNSHFPNYYLYIQTEASVIVFRLLSKLRFHTRGIHKILICSLISF